ncbi:acetyl-CoA synthetase-like protein [Basidiobolus meristosporus CBS 931.73]|uniref:Acetyl-CoA synthetase-like protein n=1 Tax=Basidiobolus meristosporus CBS 931.73 TaxID=1314790 RepID=A0A1Y1Y4N9_9FUNG|nr:acetyl-CoA synthetase-like protein [Basidiobolus meristosporus CBS 931.73]|eukprot:ORX92991.1 acetyl-CoA synthetase-like protein [Basidiobolus meristosporus CBS 931.73]
MIFSSPYPRVDIPNLDLYTFATSGRYDETAPIFLDHLTQETRCLAQVKDGSKRIAKGLREGHGFGKGCLLALVSDNHLDYSSVVFGTIATGGTCMPVNAEYKAQEMASQLSDSMPGIIISSVAVFETVKEAARLANLQDTRIFVLDSEDSPDYVWTALAYSSGVLDWTLDPEEYADSPALLMYSSGTTATPKGILLTHRNIVAHLTQFGAMARKYSDTLRGTALNTSPMCYISGFSMVLSTLLGGSLFILLPQRYSFELFLEAVEKYRIANITVAPYVISLLSKSPLVAKYDLSCMKRGFYFGSPLSRKVCDLVQEKYNMVIGSLYGMTECCGGIVFTTPSAAAEESTGYLMPNYEIKIVDEDGQALGSGQRGEICARGPSMMKGYFKSPVGAQDAFDSSGFFHSGDIGYVDESNSLHIVDRIKEVIKYKNNVVIPAELEGHLLLHPAVSEAAVIGFSSEREQTDLPCGCVVLSDPHLASEGLAEQIVDQVADRVTDFKRLRAGVIFVDHIPRNTHGKILRRILRSQIQQSHPQAAYL